MEVLRDGLSKTEVADRYGVSRPSVHAWIARYEQGGMAALADRSHRPKSCPHQIAPAIEVEICELRRIRPDARDIATALVYQGVRPMSDCERYIFEWQAWLVPSMERGLVRGTKAAARLVSAIMGRQTKQADITARLEWARDY